MSEFTTWVTATTNGATLRAIAETLGTTHPTVKNRIDRKDPVLALEIAEHYGANPIDALVAAGAISDDDVLSYAKANRVGIDAYTDLELAQIIVERLAAAEGDDSPLTTVTDIPLPDDDALPYAALRRTPEPEEGDDDFGPGA